MNATIARDPRRQVRNRLLAERLAVSGPVERAHVVQELALENMPVARSIAWRSAGRSRFGSDLEQVAYLALVRAAQDFDVAKGHDFLAYAVPCMRGAVKRYFRDSAWVVRPPRLVQQRHVELQGLFEHVDDGVEVESCFRPRSLDAPVPGDTVSLESNLADRDDRTWERTETRLLLGPHVSALPARTQQILHRRFVDDRTQQEIADEFGLSQYHVSRLLSVTLLNLRQRMTEAV